LNKNCPQYFTPFQEQIKKLSLEQSKDLLTQLVVAEPAAVSVAMNQMAGGAGAPTPSSPPTPDIADWCKCGHCPDMATIAERHCCRRTAGQCITVEQRAYMQRHVLDKETLKLVIKSRNDYYGFIDEANNNNFRYAAYRQYTLWRWGRLGKHRREVIPACVVKGIRNAYPEASGYTGFKPSVGF
jgi:hypothetical protein